MTVPSHSEAPVARVRARLPRATVAKPLSSRGQDRPSGPRILLVSPECAGFPSSLDASPRPLRARAGGLGEVTASLVSSLVGKGADVHFAMPCYPRIFGMEDAPPLYDTRRLHLCHDRAFADREKVYTGSPEEDMRGALAFQRDLIVNVIPRVRPDLIHCHDWMTGLIPAAARRRGLRTVFTVHNVHGGKATLQWIEETGIGAEAFWTDLYYERPPGNYEETRGSNAVELLASGIFAADFVNTVSPGFLRELTTCAHPSFSQQACHEMACKAGAGRAGGILNAPDDSFEPGADRALARNYDPDSVRSGKAENKRAMQERLGLEVDDRSALYFWPSRLDPVQKGCQLLEQLLPWIHWHNTTGQGIRIQVALVADGPASDGLARGAQSGIARGDVALRGFDESLSRLGYAGSDFTLVPSRYEPCGLPQMISQKYGSLPVVFHTGGLADTVRPLDSGKGTGNGFVFEHHDAGGLQWAMGEALRFLALPASERESQIARIMREASERFSQCRMADQYVALYETLLGKEVVPPPPNGTFPTRSSLPPR